MVESASMTTHACRPIDAAHADLMHATTTAASTDLVRERLWIEFELRGDLKFISHHDTLRLFRRALARARLPVRYSEGFNPHPRMTMPLPRPVGISSEAEVIIVEMQSPIGEADALDGLSKQMPGGLSLRAVRRLNAGERPQPDTVTYRFQSDELTSEDAIERIARLLQASELEVERTDTKSKDVRRIDIRPYILDIHRVDQNVIFTLRITGAGTARPGEIVALLFPDSGPANHRIHRQSVRWR